ncbi:acyl-CoA dehydrogenase family protein [Achromobacter sp. ACM03]|uniref:acyl-CoA dehydrogenase family protein n=1 Tax=Achromobacter sp. ACM03 TaxID=2769300 RepID=UPI00177C3CE6|nr:acyl-CoA dehydrogenase family protein [Achromobacter sp. ACM03]MBD9433555.1 acyl-CoA dehydrogenase family protein [Achromobacter sp. ACM03]
MSRSDFNTLSDEAFRARFRSWIAQNYPSDLRNPLKRLTGKAARTWLQSQLRDGWRAPGLPAEYGGMGLSMRKQLIYQEELERFGVARPIDHGLRLLAPVLIRYGTEEQKAYYLPRILSCADMWCQGYSEPNAGSDLANLKTAAVLEGDRYVVNGQKIWTTLATDANMIFMLVRTSVQPRKQQGITFLLADLNTPGIEIRPIRTLAGDEHFCEVFFKDVAVPAENVVGRVDEGWSVAKALLGFERFSHGSPELVRYALTVLRDTAAAVGASSSASYLELHGRHASDVADACALYELSCEAAIRGNEPDDSDHDFMMLKLFNAELLQRLTESIQELAGHYGGVIGAAPGIGLKEDLEWLYMIARPVTIFGGTAQVQRNILARRALGLPA